MATPGYETPPKVEPTEPKSKSTRDAPERTDQPKPEPTAGHHGKESGSANSKPDAPGEEPARTKKKHSEESIPEEPPRGSKTILKPHEREKERSQEADKPEDKSTSRNNDRSRSAGFLRQIQSQFNAEKQDFNITHVHAQHQEFMDPTRDLPPRPANLPVLHDDHQLAVWSHVLSTKRVLILLCQDEAVGCAAAYALLEWPERRHHERRIVDIGAGHLESSAFTLDTFTVRRFGTKEEVIIYVTFGEGNFLEQLKGYTGTWASSTQNTLRRDGMSIILHVHPSQLHDFPKELDRFHFPCWSIPFLTPLLEKYYPTEGAVALAEEILRQREAGLWGIPSDDEQFYSNIKFCLEAGYGTLDVEVKKRQAQIEKRLGHAEPEEDGEITADHLFANATRLQRAILFTATYYRDLVPSDLEKILEILLRGEKEEVEIESSRVTKKGKIKKVKALRQRDLLDLWAENPDEHLRHCQLKVVMAGNGKETVDFTQPHLRKDLDHYCRRTQPLFLRRQFDRIEQEELLFAPDATPEVARSTVRLSVAMTLAEPNRQNKEWLTKIILDLRISSSIVALSQESGSFDTMLRFTRPEGMNTIQGLVFRRLADVIREMLKYPQLRHLVHSSLEALLRCDKDAALKLVLEVAKRLRFAPEFDATYWMKRLVDESRDLVRFETYFALYSQLKQAGLRIYDLLEPISQWLPEGEKSRETLSQSSQCGLRLLLEYSIETAMAYSPADYGEWPPKYPLFRALAGDRAEAEEKLEFLVEWLFHPAQAMTEEISGAEDLVIDMQGYILELWSSILQGLDPVNARREAVQVSEILLRDVVRSTTRRVQTLLVDHWRENRQAYLDSLRNAVVNQKEQVALLKGRRAHSFHLEQQFKVLQRQIQNTKVAQ